MCVCLSPCLFVSLSVYLPVCLSESLHLSLVVAVLHVSLVVAVSIDMIRAELLLRVYSLLVCVFKRYCAM